MQRRLLKLIGVIVVSAALVTPAWAGTAVKGLSVFLPGLDRYGCLTDTGGKCVTFIAILNTTSGKFTGAAQAIVGNKSGKLLQTFPNLNFFKDCNVRVESSLYTVNLVGAAVYIASGCIAPT